MIRTSLALAIAILSVSNAVAAEQHGTLEGVWRFQEEVDRRADGSTVKTGPIRGYDGILIFTANGYMSSTLMPKGRAWASAAPTAQELSETFAASSAPEFERWLQNPVRLLPESLIR